MAPLEAPYVARMKACRGRKLLLRPTAVRTEPADRLPELNEQRFSIPPLTHLRSVKAGATIGPETMGIAVSDSGSESLSHDASELLTTAQVADLLHMTPAGLRRWRQRSFGPPATRIGRNMLYRRGDVLDFIDQCFEYGEPLSTNRPGRRLES